MNSTLLGASLVAYFVASVLYLANLHIKRKYLAVYATLVAIAGFLIQTLRLVLQTSSHSTPFANAQEAIFFLSWAIAAVYLIVLLWFRLPAVGALAMPLSVVALAFVYRFSEKTIANDIWLKVHIVAIIASFAVFAMAFCSAVFYLVQNKLLKTKDLRGMFRKLPPLETVDSLGHTLAAIGFPLLTLGIITGIVGVELANLRAQVSETKLIASAFTWLVYAAYLFTRRTIGWRGKWANFILIIGAFLIALTTAMHRFV